MATDLPSGTDDLADVVDHGNPGIPSSTSPAAALSEVVADGAPTSRPSLLSDPSRRRALAVGLIVAELALLTAVVVFVRRDAIESELQKSVLSAISIDHPGLKVKVTGRDVTITGATLDAAAKKQVEKIALKRRGVRVVDVDGVGSVAELDPSNTGTIAGGDPTPTPATLPVRPPQVSAVFDSTSIVLTGAVPSVEARDALIGRLKGRTTGATLKDELTIPAKPAEIADLAQYRRLGTFLDTMARLPVLSADVNFDRTILSVKATVADEAGRDLLRRESVVLVGGAPDRVRGEFIVEDLSATTTTSSASASSSTVPGQTTTTAEGGTVTVPPLPSTPQAQAAQTAITTAISDRTIAFRKNSSALSDSGREVVVDASAALKGNSAKVEVGGHTDSRGRTELNQGLSQERADAVRDAMIEAGIEAARITAKGYGEDVPIATNDSESGRAENRRIEIRVVG